MGKDDFPSTSEKLNRQNAPISRFLTPRRCSIRSGFQKCLKRAKFDFSFWLVPAAGELAVSVGFFDVLNHQFIEKVSRCSSLRDRKGTELPPDFLVNLHADTLLAATGGGGNSSRLF
jgi:hypothetical protein